jgi:hypothetical protein
MGLTLADVTAHAQRLITDLTDGIERLLDGVTAEDAEVVAIFDPADAEGMQILRELGIDVKDASHEHAFVLRLPQVDLEAAYRRHKYVPIDELPGYEPGTVLVFAFTMSVVVARRYQARPAGSPRGMREVQRTRDVEIWGTGLSLEGKAAIEFIVQKCSPVLLRLWDGSTDRVAIIDSASHGAKTGFVPRDVVVDSLRNVATRAPSRDRDAYLGMADSIAAGPKQGMITCLIQGWGGVQIEHLKFAEMAAGEVREHAKSDEDQLREYVVACRDQKRTLGLLEKSLDRIGSSSPPSAATVAELVALVRHEWHDCDAILAKIPQVMDALLPILTVPAAARLRRILTALLQATTERKRGGAINARGGAG